MQAEERQSDVVGVSYFRLLQLLRGQGLEPRAQNELSLAFPADDIAGRDGANVRPAFMGLLGVAGALPYHYTERIASAVDEGPREFLDLFSARALELFDAAWRKHRPPCEAFMRLLMALGGASDPALAQYAGLTGRAIASAQAMQRALSEYFGVEVRVEQFVGGWQMFAAADRNALGRGCATLGRDVALGEREWRCDQGLRVHVGPLAKAEYAAFLPREAGAQALARMVGGMAGGAAGDGEVCVHLAASCVRAATLDGAAQLGYNAFVLTSEENEPRSELRYQL
ncbi:type VI secretion system baseplate subunit TssG [Pseudoduganella sp. UC29_106]|uniref:type VI secretion system baseplate subunit TssG n=1 Tax=Pseudoduganella sp. UC29_106 TaxID=3374553 RepID=UPI0037573D3B